MTTERRNKLFPSIRAEVGEALIAERVGLSLEDIQNLGAVEHPKQYTVANLEVVGPELIEEIQAAIRAIAKEFGFPEPLSVIDRQSFDRSLGTALLDLVRVDDVFAAKREMWVFLSCVVLPELAPWRYQSDNFNQERMLGQDRDLLRSRWWRAWSLGPDLNSAPTNCEPLREDEFTSIMERPAIGYTKPLAQAVRDCVWRHEKKVENQRMTFTRVLARRVVSERLFRSLDDLSPRELARTLDDMASEICKSIEDAR